MLHFADPSPRPRAPFSATLGLRGTYGETTLASSRPLSATPSPFDQHAPSFPFRATLPFDRIGNVKTCRGLPFTPPRIPEIADQESISCSWRLRDEKTRKRESFRSWLIFVSKFLNRDEGSMRSSVTRRNIKVISKRVNSCDANKRMQLTMAVAGKHVYFIDVIFTGWPTTCLLSKTHNAASIRSLGKLP